MNINVFNIIIICGIVQGFIFSLIVLLNPKYKSKSNLYLSLLIIFISLNNLYYWVIDVGYIKDIRFYDNFYIPWNLLIIPMYFYFVITYLKAGKIKYIFLAPFFISLIFHFFILLYKLFFEKHFKIDIESLNIFYYGEEYFSAIFTVFVIYKTLRFIKRYTDENRNYKKKNIIINTKWLKELLFFGICICILWFFLTLYSQYYKTGQLNIFGKYFLWISLSFLMYWLGYAGVYYNGIFNQRKDIRKNLLTINKPPLVIDSNPKIDEIKHIIIEEKLFLNPNLNLLSISKRFQLNESYFSSLFNQNSTINFPVYINKLRIEEAKNLLKNNEYKKYTLTSVALEAGFNSKSAFYKSFKKEVGCTPTEFKKRNLS